MVELGLREVPSTRGTVAFKLSRLEGLRDCKWISSLWPQGLRFPCKLSLPWWGLLG